MAAKPGHQLIIINAQFREMLQLASAGENAKMAPTSLGSVRSLQAPRCVWSSACPSATHPSPSGSASFPRSLATVGCLELGPAPVSPSASSFRALSQTAVSWGLACEPPSVFRIGCLGSLSPSACLKIGIPDVGFERLATQGEAPGLAFSPGRGSEVGGLGG